jgi:NADPH-dependent glutamate synthase beta subunit-like oxidoreductase
LKLSESKANLKRRIYQNEKEMPEVAKSESGSEWNRTGSWSTVVPIHQNKSAPCQKDCPVGVDIPIYLDLIKQKKYQKAYKIVKDTNPMPAITGRVCYHPCEDGCNRKILDQPLAIHSLERFIGDWGLENVPVKKIKTDPQKGKIAIVGSGPAGLSCAYHLSRKGYSVTIFEKESQAGGMLRLGIPEYRLPERVLDRELKSILDLGIELKLNCQVGKDVSWEEMKKFAAVFIATGAYRSKKMNVSGENLEQIKPALEFLINANLGEKFDFTGQKVLVLGRGNTAIDAARAALRFGAEVSILSRSGIEEMIATQEETGMATEEGVQIVELVDIGSFEWIDSASVRVNCVRLQREVNKNGQVKYTVVKDSEFSLSANLVLVAKGQDADLEILPDELEKESAQVKIDRSGRTSAERFFAGGDLALTTKTVAYALGSGRKAALAIEAYLNKMDLVSREENVLITRETDLNLAYFVKAPRENELHLDPESRKLGFKEVNAGMSQEAILKEVARCFSCGTCNSCDNCYTYCPDLAVYKDNHQYKIMTEYCKGCGICVQECPRDVIELVVKTGNEL